MNTHLQAMLIPAFAFLTFSSMVRKELFLSYERIPEVAREPNSNLAGIQTQACLGLLSLPRLLTIHPNSSPFPEGHCDFLVTSPAQSQLV